MNKQTLYELVAGVLNVPVSDLTPETGSRSMTKWDSLAHVTIIAAVEQTYSVQLTMPEILSIHSMADLESILARHLV